MGKLVQKFLPKQADIDEIFKIIQRKVLKCTHVPAKIKEIQAGYLVSPYFKDIYMYLAQNKLPSTKIPCYLNCIYTSKGNSIVGNTRNMCSQNYYTLPFKSICKTSRSYKNLSHNK